jgi:ubiquinone/menaquinone biosynthesis C-methylase UbiE
MAGEASGYVGSIPHHYDQNLGPLLFTDYAADLACRIATLNPRRVLETAAGTGIVTRALRDALPANAKLTATDLNAPMLDIAATKFHPSEAVDFRTADATALPFADASFDAIVCQFGVMFFPDKDKSYREAFRVLATGGHYVFSIWDSHYHNPIGR